MLPSESVIEEYLDDRGVSPFAVWFADLDARAAAKVTVALSRIERGAISNLKGVGEGVLEFRIDFGPGYRIYLGRDGDRLVILLTGGTKRRQNEDIADAKARWSNYKARKARARKKGGA
jgi:putative addiction module killer protein